MDSSPFRELTGDECRDRLRPGGIGRVGVSVAALPAIFPVRFALLGNDVVFRAASTGRFSDAISNAIVAFQSDAVDERRNRAWTVLVVGATEAITSDDELEVVASLALPPWGEGSDNGYTRVSCERISGRDYALPAMTDR